MPYSSIFLSQIVERFELEVVYDSGDIEERRITVADVTRPGLQLAGYYDHFGPDRLQIVGNMEHAFLNNLTSEDRKKATSSMVSLSRERLLVLKFVI